MKEVIEKIDRLKRRRDHLEERLADPHRSENSKSWDRSEASALSWAIIVCEIALSNSSNLLYAALEQHSNEWKGYHAKRTRK